MIREAVVKDASRLAEILIFAKRMAYRPIFQNDEVSFNEMQVLDLALYFRNAEDALKDVFVYDDGIVKGMIHIGRRREDDKCWRLEEIYVDPFFQKEGIGKALLIGFLERAKQNKINKVFLWVLEKNSQAIKFYESFLFWTDGTKKLEPGTKEYVIKYTLEL